MSLCAREITKSYGDSLVIHSFSHSFREGAVTAIMGPSGCGKTTLINILMGIIKPDGGSLTGGDVPKSAVFQEDRLCENLSVLSNLRLIHGRRADNAMLTAELGKVGLAEHINKPAKELSGGMKRRLALVRALTAQYELLFLDEPFKGLDEDTKLSVMAYCKEKTAGRTVIMVTHDASEAEYFGAEKVILKSEQ